MSKHEITCPHKLPISQCPEHWAIFKQMTDTPQLSLRDIYERCDVSNNRTDNPMSFEEFRQAILTLIASAKSEKQINTKDESDGDFFFGYGYNAGIDNYEASLLRKLEGKG